MRHMTRGLWLVAGLLAVLGCATAPTPGQPEPSEPYAAIELPASVRLLGIDDRRIDARSQVTTLRLAPGRHTLRLAYTAGGAGASPAHDGQVAAPFPIDVRAGHTYRFVART